MKELRDISQYGNEKVVLVNHYLIQITGVDRNSVNDKFAVICTMIDWKQAFDRQCTNL